MLKTNIAKKKSGSQHNMKNREIRWKDAMVDSSRAAAAAAQQSRAVKQLKIEMRASLWIVRAYKEILPYQQSELLRACWCSVSQFCVVVVVIICLLLLSSSSSYCVFFPLLFSIIYTICVCILVALLVSLLLLSSRSTVAAWNRSLVCVSHEPHKAIAKGKNITIFQFSFVCISTRWRRSECIFCADFKWNPFGLLYQAKSEKRVRAFHSIVYHISWKIKQFDLTAIGLSFKWISSFFLIFFKSYYCVFFWTLLNIFWGHFKRLCCIQDIILKWYRCILRYVLCDEKKTMEKSIFFSFFELNRKYISNVNCWIWYNDILSIEWRHSMKLWMTDEWTRDIKLCSISNILWVVSSSSISSSSFLFSMF